MVTWTNHCTTDQQRWICRFETRQLKLERIVNTHITILPFTVLQTCMIFYTFKYTLKNVGIQTTFETNLHRIVVFQIFFAPQKQEWVNNDRNFIFMCTIAFWIINMSLQGDGACNTYVHNLSNFWLKMPHNWQICNRLCQQNRYIYIKKTYTRFSSNY